MATSIERAAPVAHRRRDEIATLRRLLAEQVDYIATRPDLDASMDYLQAHFAMDITLRRHLMAIDLLVPYIHGRVLEWGCRHALDSCVYRMRLGDRVDLHGCDVFDRDLYRPFHDFSGLHYRQIRHHYLLDYEDDSFDVVTSNGVLEHVPDDAGSIGEIFRILRPGGTFVITCLPNRYSYTEALQRLRKGHAHDRLYTFKSTSALLQDRGFVVTHTRRFLMLPTMLNGFPQRLKLAYQRMDKVIWPVNALLERLWPLNILASNLMLVARKPLRTV